MYFLQLYILNWKRSVMFYKCQFYLIKKKITMLE